MGKNISKNIRSKYSQKLLDLAKQSATDALKIKMMMLQNEQMKEIKELYLKIARHLLTA